MKFITAMVCGSDLGKQEKDYNPGNGLMSGSSISRWGKSMGNVSEETLPSSGD